VEPLDEEDEDKADEEEHQDSEKDITAARSR
jgi:hypothetical protein